MTERVKEGQPAIGRLIGPDGQPLTNWIAWDNGGFDFGDVAAGTEITALEFDRHDLAQPMYSPLAPPDDQPYLADGGSIFFHMPRDEDLCPLCGGGCGQKRTPTEVKALWENTQRALKTAQRLAEMTIDRALDADLLALAAEVRHARGAG